MEVKINVGQKAPDFTLPDADLNSNAKRFPWQKSCVGLLSWRFHGSLHEGDVHFQGFSGKVERFEGLSRWNKCQ